MFVDSDSHDLAGLRDVDFGCDHLGAKGSDISVASKLILGYFFSISRVISQGIISGDANIENLN